MHSSFYPFKYNIINVCSNLKALLSLYSIYFAGPLIITTILLIATCVNAISVGL